VVYNPGEPMASSPAPPFQVHSSRHFPAWLAEQATSLAFSTYQSGKLFLVGLKPSGELSVFERTFNRCMGLWSDGQTLWMSAAFQLWRFENALAPGQLERGFDRLFVPRVGFTTGDIDIHDVAVDGEGRVVFVNTLFSCLATTSDTASFSPRWRPPFISRLAAEDRCHLNGLALEAGRPRYVTAAAASDVADGWRERRQDGGVVLDVASGEAVLAGLSMPHSPRIHAGRLWLLDSGNGFLGFVDRARGVFEPAAFCPGYARGLAFAGEYAVVGLSKPREATFAGLPLSQNLAARGSEARCGLVVVDLRTGDTLHWLRLEGVVEELYDVVALPGVARPTALGFKTDEIRYTVTCEGEPTIWRAGAGGRA
jgi:uncharacterized protein (TIGR03032 family)